MSGSSGEYELQERNGTRERADQFYRTQVLDHLNARMIAFVGRMDMAFIATANDQGECDASFRAGDPGFLHVIDEHAIAYPEYRGNGVMASLGNIHTNPHVGILLIDFTQDRIGLHINGRAHITDDVVLRSSVSELPLDHRGRGARLWVVVQVVEAYIHCRKHIPHLTPGRGDDRHWGTDNPRAKGGDYFHTKAESEVTLSSISPGGERDIAKA
ncbi:pyridoxamine 5'-phosphate oxidase family protein [Nocardia flavorosea]|uniref:pyridoxamine 5'-phosphate oxidase family protein n=1 Tax=Nocardia flavorosea TaxID=53429 RepID=UPI002458D374|nr:pyridoxamine 5'-phosphate oxidase family protein [Nocardia flavorosea]